MEGFLTFILVFILIVWLIGRFFPLLLAWWIKHKFGKITRDNRYSKQRESSYKEGDVIVEVEKKEKKIVDSNVGEYIDYEETKKS